jgi:hypothetical protein
MGGASSSLLRAIAVFGGIYLIMWLNEGVVAGGLLGLHKA